MAVESNMASILGHFDRPSFSIASCNRLLRSGAEWSPLQSALTVILGSGLVWFGLLFAYIFDL